MSSATEPMRAEQTRAEQMRKLDFVVSMNFAHIAKAGGVIDFTENLVQAMRPLLGDRLTVVRPRTGLGRVAQVFMRYAMELVVELRYWRRSAVVLFPNYFIVPLPFSRLKRVVVIHDLQFRHYPQYASRLKRWLLDVSCKLVQRHADGVVFISQSTEDDFIRFYGRPRRHKTIYNPIAVDTGIRGGDAAAASFAPYAIGAFHYYPHKNLPRLLEVFKAVRAVWPELRLVLTGHRPPDLESLLGGKPADLGVEHLGFLDKPAVLEKLAGARFFISMSQFEGFNMSAAEAALLGRPLILSDIPVHQEVFSDLALLLPPESSEVPADKLRAYVEAALATPPDVNRLYQRVAPTSVAREYVAFIDSV